MTSSTRAGATSAAAGPTSAENFSHFTPPYAAPDPFEPRPAWTDQDDSNGWNAKKIAMAGLALGGAAATTYFMRKRMRRRTRMEQFADLASDAFESAQTFAQNRHPAWWASLAAAALPAAYYAWPTPKPTYTEQARWRADDLASYLESSLAAWLPAMQDTAATMTGRVRHQLPDHLPADWSRQNVAGAVGALAAGALTIFLIRKATRGSSSGTRIADVMTRRPRVIQPNATVAEAAAMMRRLDVGALPVCDGSRLIGMLTDRDITTRSTADGRDPHLTPVRDVMSPNVAWATEDDLVEEAARIMREHRIRRLPIVDERHGLVGVVSLGDLAVDVNDDDLSGRTLERISEPTGPDRL
jgi:CBS domain-containing protein